MAWVDVSVCRWVGGSRTLDRTTWERAGEGVGGRGHEPLPRTIMEGVEGVDLMGVMRSSDKSKSPKDRPQKKLAFKKQGKFWG